MPHTQIAVLRTKEFYFIILLILLLLLLPSPPHLKSWILVILWWILYSPNLVPSDKGLFTLEDFIFRSFSVHSSFRCSQARTSGTGLHRRGSCDSFAISPGPLRTISCVYVFYNQWVTSSCHRTKNKVPFCEGIT